RRPFWTAGGTIWKFLLTCLMLGIPLALLIRLTSVASAGAAAVEEVMRGPGLVLGASLTVVASLKNVTEGLIFRWLLARSFTPLKRTALLMTGVLRRLTIRRFLWGIAGGMLLPAWLVIQYSPMAPFTGRPLTGGAAALAIFCLCLASEFLERYLFF